MHLGKLSLWSALLTLYLYNLHCRFASNYHFECYQKWGNNPKSAGTTLIFICHSIYSRRWLFLRQWYNARVCCTKSVKGWSWKVRRPLAGDSIATHRSGCWQIIDFMEKISSSGSHSGADRVIHTICSSGADGASGLRVTRRRELWEWMLSCRTAPLGVSSEMWRRGQSLPGC